MTRHHITAIYDPDDSETEVRIHFTYHPGFAGDYYVNPSPPEPASVEFSHIETMVDGRWTECALEWLMEWADEYLQGNGLDDAMTTVREDQIEAEEYRAEMRAEMRRGR